MIEINKKSECCGCYGCVNICPTQCINMKIDNEGFWYPKVNRDKCINCNSCKRVCPVINTQSKNKFNTIAYACKNKNEEMRLNSSSGGVFSSLCEYVISNNGIVFGAAFNEKFQVEHMEAATLQECIKFRGSKYVQSKVEENYNKAKTYLEEGKLVLFSGTQCQIKGLNLFLRKKYDNLICIDIVCHGVPSPLVFNKYKENLKNKYNSEIKSINFRDKSKGWKQYKYKFEFIDGKMEQKKFYDNIYSKGFLSNLYLRPSCYSCKAKNFKNNSDISLADYWGVQNKHPEFDDDKGTSLILINSEKGRDIFNNISMNLDVIKTDLNYAILNNPCIVKPVDYNKRRDNFFNKINSIELEKNIQKNIKVRFPKKIIKKVRNILSKLKNKVLINK